MPEEVEQDLQSPGWGRKERMATVAEVLRQKAVVQRLVHELVDFYGECPPDRYAGEVCKETAGCYACWTRWAEREVKHEISPEG